jgi:hypothetical protein
MKAKQLVVVLAVFLAAVCLLLGGTLRHPQQGFQGLDARRLATQTFSHRSLAVSGARTHSQIKPTPLPNVSFDPGGRDSLVFIHIQKTGGSDLLRHLVTVERDHHPLCLPESAASSTPIKRKKERSLCPRPGRAESATRPRDWWPWLISEKTLGWYCGLHPFYSEYKSCIALENSLPERNRKFDPTANFHYSTMLRHPVVRYISEYLHIQRGATFSYRHICNGKKVRNSEMPPCYPGYYDRETWHNVTLSAFLSCESNWANNRQTFSVADLETVHCFNQKALPRGEREQRLLESAKQNLMRFSFFGITEYQAESAALFEKTFGLKFGQGLEQKPVGSLNSAPMLNSVWNTESAYSRIAAANHLDMQLYNFALELFAARLLAIGIEIDLDSITKEVQLLPSDGDAFKRKRFQKQLRG